MHGSRSFNIYHVEHCVSIAFPIIFSTEFPDRDFRLSLHDRWSIGNRRARNLGLSRRRIINRDLRERPLIQKAIPGIRYGTRRRATFRSQGGCRLFIASYPPPHRLQKEILSRSPSPIAATFGISVLVCTVASARVSVLPSPRLGKSPEEETDDGVRRWKYIDVSQREPTADEKNNENASRERQISPYPFFQFFTTSINYLILFIIQFRSACKIICRLIHRNSRIMYHGIIFLRQDGQAREIATFKER